MKADFAVAFDHVMDFEDRDRAGKVTEDEGGITKYGVAGKFHPGLDIKSLTFEQAEEIYREEYWNPLQGDEIENQNIANKLLNMAISMGAHQAVTLLQRALNHDIQYRENPTLLIEDGKFGAKTLAAINAELAGTAGAIRLHSLLCELSEAHYNHLLAANPDRAGEAKSWLARAKA